HCLCTSHRLLTSSGPACVMYRLSLHDALPIFRSVAAKLRNQRTDTSRDMAAKLWPKCTRQWHSIVGGCRIGVIKGAGYTHKWEEALVQGWIWLPKPPN